MKRFDWSKELRRAALVLCFWVFVGAVVNAVSPRRIAWVGHWPATYGEDTTSVPPSYLPDDPPLLRLDEAIAKYQATNVLFLDARDPADFAYGHIAGAVNVPFDDYDDYVARIEDEPRDREIVTYCGGTDCELSLYLARQLVNEGFTHVSIFFGGYTAWEEQSLPLEAETP